MKIKFSVGVIVFLLLCGGAVLAAPEIKVTVFPEKISSDQTVQLQLEIQWPKKEAQYSFAVPPLRLKNLSILRQGESQENFRRDEDEWTLKTFLMELQPLSAGKGVVQPFTLPYIDPASQKGGSFEVAEVVIPITKPPWKASGLFFGFGVVLLLLPGTAILLFLLKKKQPSAALADLLPQNEIALQKIKSLSAHTNPSRDLIFKITTEFRRFLADYFDIAGRQLTEDELLAALKNKNLDREEFGRIAGILTRLRDSKFGTELSSAELKILEKDITQYLQSKQIVQNPSH